MKSSTFESPIITHDNLKSSFKNPKERKLETVEIDFKAAARKIRDHRKIVYMVTLGFLILGLIIAFGSTIEYESSCSLLPEKKEGGLSNLGGISGSVGLTGINLDFGSQSTLSPEIYPQIVESLPFQVKLIHKELTFEKRDTTFSSYTYFKEIHSPSLLGYMMKYTLGLPQTIRETFSDNGSDEEGSGAGDVSRLSKKDFKLIERFKDRIYVDADPETGLILIEAEMPDPVAAAELTQATMDLLLQRINDHKLKKVNKNLKFIETQYEEAQLEFEEAKKNLDQIANLNSQVEEQKLQDEYELALESYKTLSTQLDQMRIKVEDERPVFTIVDPVNVPIDKSKPKRTLILLGSLFLGLFMGALIIFLFK